jgi:hypothetical protein
MRGCGAKCGFGILIVDLPIRLISVFSRETDQSKINMQRRLAYRALITIFSAII